MSNRSWRGKCGTVVTVTQAKDLENHKTAWEQLVEHAIEPNVFFEPWMLLPALEHFAPPGIEIALVGRPDGTLIGLVPLVRSPRYRGLPLSSLELWSHDYCFLATPLVHRAHAHECLEIFFSWLDEGSRAKLMEFSRIVGDGAVQHLLIDRVNERSTAVFQVDRSTRAFLLPRANADSYLQLALRGSARRKLVSKERQLHAEGDVEFVELAPGDDIERWISTFLEIEASGWKGSVGTAMAAKASDGAFFQNVMREAHRRRKLLMTELRVGKRAVAAKCSFVSGSGSFAFKVAYDETFGRYSPGALLELDNIRRVHARADLRWMDSCAGSSSRLFNELWLDRRIVESYVVSIGEPSGLLLSLMPLARWSRRQLRWLRESGPWRALQLTKPAASGH